jgi:rubrerythrin
MQNFKWRERWREAADQMEDPLDGYVLYRCQSCGWLTRDDMESRYCCECDEWARWKPVIHRPR